jgi:hypothetical protein
MPLKKYCWARIASDFAGAVVVPKNAGYRPITIAKPVKFNDNGFQFREYCPRSAWLSRPLHPFPNVYHYFFLLRRCKIVVELAVERIVASDDGNVRSGLGGSILGYASKKTENCRRGLLSALELLFKSSELNEVAESYKRLQEVTDKTRRIIDEIILLHMLPGSCRVCRRLGIK